MHLTWLPIIINLQPPKTRLSTVECTNRWSIRSSFIRRATQQARTTGHKSIRALISSIRLTLRCCDRLWWPIIWVRNLKMSNRRQPSSTTRSLPASSGHFNRWFSRRAAPLQFSRTWWAVISWTYPSAKRLSHNQINSCQLSRLIRSNLMFQQRKFIIQITSEGTSISQIRSIAKSSSEVFRTTLLWVSSAITLNSLVSSKIVSFLRTKGLRNREALASSHTRRWSLSSK